MNKYKRIDRFPDSKVTLDRLKEEIVIPDVVKQKADQAFHKIKEETQSQRIQQVSHHNKKPAVKRRIPMKRMILVAAVLVLAFGTLTVTAAYLNWSKSLTEGLQITEERRVELQEKGMVAFVGEAVTDQGITVTAMQSITDQYYTYIALRIEGYELKEGTQPDFESILVTVDGKSDFSYTSSFYNGLIQGASGEVLNGDQTPAGLQDGHYKEQYRMDDGSLEYRITLMNTDEVGYFMNKPIHIELSGLGTVEKAQVSDVISGKWSFDWELKGSDENKEYKVKAPLGETGATVLRAEITPISMQVDYQFPRQKVSEEGVNEKGEAVVFQFDQEPPRLAGVKLKDGTLYPYLSFGLGSSGYQSETKDLYRVSFSLEKVIDTEQIEALLFVKNTSPDGTGLSEEDYYVVTLP